MEALRVERLSRSFDGVRALDDVSFSVRAGERLGIIGPNGAGKSTLFNVLSGILPPTTGKISLYARDITDLPVHRRARLGLARSFQTVNLFPSLTAFENLFLAAQGSRPSRYRLFPPLDARRDIVSRVEQGLVGGGLWAKRSEPVDQLSHGEQRKLEFVMSLVMAPKVLLLDEPGAGLATGERVEIADMIGGLGAAVTALIVEHDMDLLFRVADRVLLLHYGEVIAQGSANEMRDDPRVNEVYLGTDARAHP